MFPPPLLDRAAALLGRCRSARLRIASAESCTGGLLAALLTEIPGASDVFERGFVTYSNEAKSELLGVPEALLREHGAVSGEAAQAMAEGALARARVELSAAITGIAGPGGASAEKSAGLVYLASARKDHRTVIEKRRFSGNRHATRMAAVALALELLDQQID